MEIIIIITPHLLSECLVYVRVEKTEPFFSIFILVLFIVSLHAQQQLVFFQSKILYVVGVMLLSGQMEQFLKQVRM